MMRRVPLCDGWTLWPQACLRGAGFPIDLLQRLAMPESAAQSNALEAKEEAAKRARAECLGILRNSIEAHEGKARKPYAKAIKALKRGDLPQGEPARTPEAADALQAARCAHDEVAAQERLFSETFAKELDAIQSELESIANDERFREAVAWQNLSGLRTGVDKIASGGVKYQRLVANYIQRYCAKNDTIGFFGPVGWASIDESSPSSISPGPSLLAKRTVYFEHWAIEALCEQFSENAALLQHACPRTAPKAFVEGETLYHSGNRSNAIPPEMAAAIVACDGDTSAIAIASALESESIVGDVDEGLELLESLAEQGLIYWRFEVPTSEFFPEAALREQLVRIPSQQGAQALAQLDELIEARDAVQSSSGSVDALCQALDELNTVFHRSTGRQATREGGKVYAGRTLVFEDCRRDMHLTLGEDFVHAVAAPLTLVLKSSAWYTWEIARRYSEALEKRFREVCSTPDEGMGFLAFQAAFRDLFPGPKAKGGIVAEVLQELQARWQRILGENEEGSEASIQLRANDIAAEVEAAFPAPHPGWPSARHHSPDLMLAAPGRDAFLAGNYQVILGEIHVGLATPSIPLFCKEHPNPEKLVELREEDLPAPGIAPTWNRALRANLYSLSRHDYDLELGTGRSRRQRSQVLSAAECQVLASPAGLVVRSRRTGMSFPLIAFIEQHLIAESYSEFSILGASREHSPRLTIDSLVIRRAQWRVQREELAVIDKKIDRSSMFHAVRRWAAAKGLPRYCFVVSPTETKPFYVDFDNTLAIENFARYIRPAERFVVSEMLPGPTEAWLPDASEKLYCSELRLCATTPKPWPQTA